MRPPKILGDFLAEPVECNAHIRGLPIHEGTKHIPKYAGYVPTIKFDQGHTFPDHTMKYLKNHRSREIGKEPPEEKGWYIPQDHDHKHSCVKGLLDCMHKECHVTSQTHLRFNVERIKERNTNEFYNAIQTQRNMYKHCYKPGQPVKYLQTAVRGPSMFTD
ncbi:ciliary microtubule inner protein 2C-like [Symsagittifera roscoffensis]|uniref:ciliary microtubule inner protein 2C-like n=1 Tax=Symsagittifera roscoffensis TaxID=84072 RepID=UPI00307B989A